MVAVTPHILESCGRLLFGTQWRHGFEDFFSLSNRSLRRMLNGQATIPAGLVLELETAVRDHLDRGDRLLEALTAVDEPADVKTQSNDAPAQVIPGWFDFW